MLINRIEFSLPLITTSPLFLHDGHDFIPEGEEHRVRSLVLDNDGNPLIPASTAKGALRARLTDQETADRLFGHVKNSISSVGAIGNLELDDAISTDKGTLEKRRRTTISRQTGAAARNRLFEDGALEPGHKFTLTGRLFFADDNPDEAVEQLLSLLAHFNNEANPFIIGSGGKFGNGRLKQDTPPALYSHIFDAEFGDWPITPVPIKSTNFATLPSGKDEKTQTRFSISLTSTTPFLIADGAPKISDEEADIKPLRDRDGNTVIPQSSIYGALRSRMAWLSELKQLQSNPNDFQPNTAKLPADDRDLNYKCDGGLTNHGQIKELSSTERLFGVSGFKGLLECKQVRCDTTGTSIRLVNVAIDRFTGGALDGALYTTEAVTKSKWTILLSIPNARADAVYLECKETTQLADLDLLLDLLNDLKKNGLMLGHGTTKGLGWFDVEYTDQNLQERLKNAR